MKNILSVLFIGFAAWIFFNSCKKKFEEPAVKKSLVVSGYITIDSIYKKYRAYYKTAIPKPAVVFKFSNDVNLECTVTADETSGNIYKTVYVQDATGALQIKLANKGGLYVGDKIRINLNGVVLDDYGSMIQLDSLDINSSATKINSGNSIKPTKLTFNQFLTLNPDGQSPYQSRLVQLDSVEFTAGSKNQTMADALGKYTIDRGLMDANGQQVVVRTSGYSNFAGNIIPCGKGSIVAIIGQYNSAIQLTIRDFKEVKLANNGCPLLIKSFDDQNMLSGGWSNYKVSGNIDWKVGSFNGQFYGQISNFVSGGNNVCETWLISPVLNISPCSNPRFSFQSAFNYTGPTIQLYVSTNYNSGDPNLATWTILNPTLSGGSWNWIQSGVVSLSSFKSANTRIAFKYNGTSSDGSTWEIDDIAVFGE